MRAAAFFLTACLFAFAFLFAGTARAAIYETTINVDTEDDLFELEQAGDISEDTSQTLLELLNEGVDLNSATREELYDLPGLTYADVDAILEYRKSRGQIEDPAELVAAGAVTAEQLISIAPFLRLDALATVLPVSGKLQASTRFTTLDNVPPPAFVKGKVKGPLNLSAGFMAMTTRRRAAAPVYDPLTDQLTSKGFLYTPHLPRIYAQWKPGNARLVAGTFQVGFAERLTLDTSRRTTPRGIYLIEDYRRPQDLSQTCKISGANLLLDPTSGCDTSEGAKNLYISPDYSWREAFRGVAGSIEDLKLGDEASLSLYGFGSYQQRPIYQYDLYDRRYCADPNDDNDSNCDAPIVYLGDGSSRLVFSTLNQAFDELAGGGHITFKPSYRVTLGVTGYAALPIFRQSPLELDFQEQSRYPSGGAFGAIGVDAHTSFKQFNFFLEATHNFDRRVGTDGQGGWGAEQRTTFSPRGHELELSLRFYDTGFGTVYSRPIAGPDVSDGQRARNEAGARLRWVAKWSKDWETRLTANFWVNPFVDDKSPQAGVPNLNVIARVDFNGWKAFQPALWVDMRNRNLPYSEHGVCSPGTIILTEDGQVACGGDTYKLGFRIDTRPLRKIIQGSLQATYSWRDDIRYKDKFRNDLTLRAEVKTRPIDALQFRVVGRYVNQDLADPAYLEEFVWTYADATWFITKGTQIALRYDLLYWLDQRASTPARVPNPENRFQLDVRFAF